MLFAFRLCLELGIDDPVTWMDHVPAKVLDQWIAYYSVVADKESGRGEMMSPADALKRLTNGR